MIHNQSTSRITYGWWDLVRFRPDRTEYHLLFIYIEQFHILFVNAYTHFRIAKQITRLF